MTSFREKCPNTPYLPVFSPIRTRKNSVFGPCQRSLAEFFLEHGERVLAFIYIDKNALNRSNV